MSLGLVTTLLLLAAALFVALPFYRARNPEQTAVPTAAGER
jgi:hypothetical protein